jgi:DNA-binding beta-propeller fold protein YncE
LNGTAIRSAARTAALLAAGVAVRFTHLAVAYAIVIGDNRKTIPFVLALLLGAPPVMEALRLRGRLFVRAALGVPYYAVVAVYLATALYVVGPMGPAVFAAFALLAAGFGLALRRGARLPVAFALVLPAVLHAAHLAPGVAAAVLALFAVALLVRRTGDRTGIGPLPLAVALFSTMVHVEAATFYRGVSVFDALRRPDARFVTPVPRARPLRLITKDDGDPRYLLPTCSNGVYLYGARGRGHALELLDEKRAEPIATALPGAEAGDTAAIDCARGVVWAGDYASDRLYRLRAADLAVEKVVTLPSPHPTFVALDSVASELYVATDFGGSLAVLDVESGALRRTLTVPGGIAHFALDPKGRRVFAVGGGGQLHVFETPAWRPRAVRKFPGALLFQLAYDETIDRVYLSNFLTGMLYAIDGRTFAVVARRWLGASLRSLVVSRNGCGDPVVDAASYFSGRVTRLTSDLRPRGSIHAGKRVRWLTSAGPGELLTTSTCGPIAITFPECKE